MSRDRAPRVFLGRLPRDIKEKDVERFFRGFGRIREINLKNGFGFVEFQDYKDADDAVYEMNHKELMGERITVEHARPTSRSGGSGGGGGGGGGGGRDGGSGMRRGGGFRFRDRYGAPYNTEYKVTVENLSSRASWQDLKDYMRQAGEVTFTQCHRDRIGEGVVEFASLNDMQRALKRLDGTELLGKRLRLTERGGRPRRSSRSLSPQRRPRSRSRSPRRSRSPVNRGRHSRSPMAQRRSLSPRRGESPGRRLYSS
ncbi:serine/arginine-rich splicing factor 6-like isoform X2 [Montipora capricornis]|uniref:serine/arginine-rich splicing factor 6-like isoform X2 n=1 Tax=Montipora foliosa TaxID=591990 RepID=UPI0035F1AF52